MRIAIVQREDARDITVHSGVYYFMAQSLAKHVGQVVYLCPDRSLISLGILNLGRLFNYASRFLFRRRLSASHNRILAKRLARVFGKRLKKCKCDVVFAPNASVEIANIKSDVPIIYRTDLNWADIVDYYPGSSSLFDFIRATGEDIDAAAIRKAAAVIYPSDWAAHTATAHYGAPSEKIFSIPCGANLHEDEVPAREQALGHRISTPLQLLWLGVDWERKGGPIAFNCLLELLRLGIDARLTVCGCIPPTQYHHSAVNIIPFLSKRNPTQRKALSDLLLQSHFFLFPTRAEAYGLVLCEASAHGLPSLVSNTGGVGGAIRDNENGYILPITATGPHFAQRICEIIESPEAYARLVLGSRNAYETRLNWDAWGITVKPIFEAVIKNKLQ